MKQSLLSVVWISVLLSTNAFAVHLSDDFQWSPSDGLQMRLVSPTGGIRWVPFHEETARKNWSVGIGPAAARNADLKQQYESLFARNMITKHRGRIVLGAPDFRKEGDEIQIQRRNQQGQPTGWVRFDPSFVERWSITKGKPEGVVQREQDLLRQWGQFQTCQLQSESRGKSESRSECRGGGGGWGIPLPSGAAAAIATAAAASDSSSAGGPRFPSFPGDKAALGNFPQRLQGESDRDYRKRLQGFAEALAKKLTPSDKSSRDRKFLVLQGLPDPGTPAYTALEEALDSKYLTLAGATRGQGVIAYDGRFEQDTKQIADDEYAMYGPEREVVDIGHGVPNFSTAYMEGIIENIAQPQYVYEPDVNQTSGRRATPLNHRLTVPGRRFLEQISVVRLGPAENPLILTLPPLPAGLEPYEAAGLLNQTRTEFSRLTHATGHPREIMIVGDFHQYGRNLQDLLGAGAEIIPGPPGTNQVMVKMRLK